MSANILKINLDINKLFSKKCLRMREKLKKLPNSKLMDKLLAAIKQHTIVIVVGETGSGKTTQLPKAILPIVCVQATPLGSLPRATKHETELSEPFIHM